MSNPDRAALHRNTQGVLVRQSETNFLGLFRKVGTEKTALALFQSNSNNLRFQDSLIFGNVFGLFAHAASSHGEWRTKA